MSDFIAICDYILKDMSYAHQWIPQVRKKKMNFARTQNLQQALCVKHKSSNQNGSWTAKRNLPFLIVENAQKSY